MIRNYPQSVVNAMDQHKRTPLHYAAALRDGGYLYKQLRKAGADPNIFDCVCNILHKDSTNYLCLEWTSGQILLTLSRRNQFGTDASRHQTGAKTSLT